MDVVTKALDLTATDTEQSHMQSQKQKEANDFKWYKNKADEFISMSFSGLYGYGDVADYTKMKVNYDLFNNKLNVNDLLYVTQPYGNKVGEAPAKMKNRDIVSTKINALIGMELKRPFEWRAIAINDEAINRKKAVEFSMMADAVNAEIMIPIRQQIEIQEQQKLMQQTEGRKMSQDEINQMKQGIEQEMERQTPEQVRRYMARKYRDPAETLNEQILKYLIPELRLKNKFNKAFKHALLSGAEIYYRGIVDGNPIAKVCNPLNFDSDRSPENDFIEEGEWAVMKYMMTPSQIVSAFGTELTKAQIKEIYNLFPEQGIAGFMLDANLDHLDWSFSNGGVSRFTVPVYHVEFKSLRKIKFLKYLDNETGVAEMIVTDSYKFNPMAGDLSVEEMWIPEVHEVYKISPCDIYLCMRPVPGQHKDLNNLWDCKLSYSGAYYDSLNSCSTSIMDRMIDYQYLYNIVMYRIEKLMASDKGKKVLMNMNLIPKSMGIDVDKWLYYMDNLDIMFYNPREEGNKNGSSNVGEIAKEIDMSLASQINQYIQLADYIDAKCGQAIGVPRQVEGEISPSEAVTNVKQILVQTSNVLEPLYELHNIVKANFLNGLMETAKVAYATGKPRKLSYILDDMSMEMLEVDQELLDNNTCGIYVSNSLKANEIKQTIDGLAHAAMQNGAVDLSTVVKVISSYGLQEAQENLEMGEAKKAAEVQQQAMGVEQAREQAAEKARAFEREKMEFDRETKLQLQQEESQADLMKQTVLSLGFSQEKDVNQNKVPDVIDVANQALENQIKLKQTQIDERSLDHQIRDDREKNRLKEMEIKSKPKPKS